MVYNICNIDEVAYYADIRRFEEFGIEPQTTPCDYCLSKACLNVAETEV